MLLIARRACPVLALLCLLATAACSTHNTTLAPREPGTGQVIYRISEEQAFITVLDTYAEVLPKQSLFDITSGARRGYQATFRFGPDTYTQKVLIVPAVGADSTGREVAGYWFDVSGGGTAGISGAAKNRELFRRIVEPRHARLAVHAAHTVVVFVLETRPVRSRP